jgi:hypothetical protein
MVCNNAMAWIDTNRFLKLKFALEYLTASKITLKKLQ